MGTNEALLLKDIEYTRERMVYCAMRSSMSSHKVVQLSMELDELLNMYALLIKK